MSVPLWVTGVGLVTSLGVGVEPTWARLLAGDVAIRRIRNFPVEGQRSTVAGEVDGIVVGGRGGSRTSAMAVLAADEAMRMAALDVRRRRVGLVVGSTTGGMFETEQLLARLHAEPECREALTDMLSHPLTAVGDCIAERLGPFARVRMLSSACSSGANVVVVAAAWLRSGEVDAVVAGGADGLCRLTLTGFNALGALDTVPCRPFDRHRNGTSLGEGAGFLVLERAEAARDRGAPPVAELAGWAAGSEAHHITNPAADGAVVAALIARALGRAGLSAADVDYVSAHGTGTPINDPIEAAALRRALGAEIDRIPVSSSKGQIGHALGAAGAIEAVITALAVQRRTIVPSGGLKEPDPEALLVHVPGAARQVPRVRAAVSCAFGFGGMDTVLVFADASLGAPRPPPPARAAVVTAVAVVGAFGILSGEACATIPDRRGGEGPPVDLDAHVDPTRGRRLDRTALLGVVAAQRALADAGGADPATGIVLGSAFGNVDGSAAFMHRIFDRGPRAASPAEFPNLVPSSPVGHASIYLKLKGPAFATADLGTSGESAFVQAVQLVSTGEARRMVAGAVEPRSAIVEHVLASLFGPSASQGRSAPTAVAPASAAARGRRGGSDVAAALVVEDAAANPTGALARVVRTLEWRDSPADALALVGGPKTDRAEIVVAHVDGAVDAWLAATAWARCPRVACAPAVGESDGIGGVALAVAAARISAGMAAEALVVGVDDRRGYFIVLSAP